jgi:hypothetical protein
MGHGGNRKKQRTNSSLEQVTVAQAAELLNVGTTGVKLAREVIDKGAPEVTKAVEAGELSVSAAVPFAELPKEEQPTPPQELPSDTNEDKRRSVTRVLQCICPGSGTIEPIPM